MSDENAKDIGGLFAEPLNDGVLLWSRNPKRKPLKENADFNEATDTKDNVTIHFSARQALLFLEYLLKRKEKFEKAIIEDALGRFRHYP